ncbi:hypothetical protein [Streptomyces sp. NPDC058045]|uniref:DNA polymerase Y family protein n=1 Tax=Streptomyces sp. NPDC058045 TaxID=3346311 RepID=UPI0036EBED38
MTTEPLPAHRASIVHIRCPEGLRADGYRAVLELLSEFSSVVQALPPRAALVELRGAARYFGTAPERLAEIVRLRALVRLGTDLRIGVGPTVTVAATASARAPHPGGVLAVSPGQVPGFLGPLPVEALHGCGPRHATALAEYGLHTVGALAAAPPATVQRILGGRTGRLLADRAHGVDPRPVVPRRLPPRASVRHRFDGQRLDGASTRAALLGLVVRLGRLLRDRRQKAQALTLRLDFAGGTGWEKTVRLPEPSAHEDDLRTGAYRAMDAAGLQRGRLTAIVLRAEDLLAAEHTAEQISLDPARDARLRAEAAMDRARHRFGPTAIGPATTFPRAS